MYKKITHNIVEEHFDHPLAAKIKAGLKPTRRVIQDFGDEDIIFGRPTTEIFNKADFIARLGTYLNNYTQKIIQIGDSTAGTEEQLVNAFEELFNFVDEVGDFFDPFYSRELGERVTTSFRHIASMSTMLSHAVKAGFDTSPWIRSLNGAVSVGGPMINYNTVWNSTVIQTPMSEFLNAIIKRTEAVKANDTEQVTQLTSNLYLYIGIFKNIIADGITQQFPQRFTT